MQPPFYFVSVREALLVPPMERDRCLPHAQILPPVWVQKSPDSLSRCFSRSELQPQVGPHRQAVRHRGATNTCAAQTWT